jgi:hypothetical protein
MNRLCKIALAAALLAVPITAQAQCGGYGGYGGYFGYGGEDRYGCYGSLGWMPAYYLIAFPHPQANLFPSGGWTLYPGEAGSGVPSHSHYSHVFGIVPPAVAANGVLLRLQQLGVPIKAPEPQFLGRNPAAADNVIPPTPRGWLPKDEEKDKNGAANNQPPPRKDKDKDKNDKNDKDKNDKDKNDKDKSSTERLDPPNVEKKGL